MGKIYSVVSGGGGDYWLFAFYRPTRVASVSLLGLHGLEHDTPLVTSSEAPVQQKLELPFDVSFVRQVPLKVLVPNVRYSAPEHGAPTRFNVWIDIQCPEKDRLLVHVQSDQGGSDRTVGWLSVEKVGARWLHRTDGRWLNHQAANKHSPPIVRW